MINEKKDPMTIEEYIEKHKYRIKGNEMLEEFFDMLLSESRSSDKSAITSQIKRLVFHLLKYQFQPEKQSSSWIYTIRDSRTELENWSESSKTTWRSIGDYEMYRCYSAGRKSVLDNCPKYKADELDKIIPKDNIFIKDQLIDCKFIEDYLIKYANRDLQDIVEFLGL